MPPAKKRKTRSARPASPRRQSSGKPPTWDLSDLYASVDDPAIQKSLTGLIRRAGKFHKQHAGKLLKSKRISPARLAEALGELESIIELASKAASFAHLLHAADTTDQRHGALLTSVMQQLTEAQSLLMFFDLEWMDVPEDIAERVLRGKQLAHYRPYLTFARRYRPHKLSEEQEQVVNQLSNTGARAWHRFFDEFTASLRFSVKISGKTREMSQSDTLDLLHEADRRKRLAGARAMTEGLRKNERTLAFVFNTLLWDAQIDDEMRSFAQPMASRNLDNQIDQKTVDALLKSTEAGFPIVNRYYKLKARLLKIKKLADHDRYAPLSDKTPRVSWGKARKTVTDAFGRFSPQMAGIADEFFEKRWIDAAVRPGKSGGAFSAATVPSAHPFILMNYSGKMRDVMTLAHELGHGVHQYLSRQQGILQASTPLTLAETASVFAEMLVFERMMAEQDDPKVRLSLLCGKIEDIFATVFRQVVMTRFEQSIHNARRKQGDLSVEVFNKFWTDANQAMFGDSLELSDGYGWWWSYVPHFVRTPFYCYAYSFGELLVIALYGQYRKQGASFVPKYMELLSSGGTGTPEDLLAPLGIDIRKPSFWKQGIGFIDDLVRQAEELAGNG
ncbi:MAG: M3 family oligoendopeptidase [Planctomycetes bacterium]|nr:M3 family oligoendopeptidase [Planctomycetota bacterium]